MVNKEEVLTKVLERTEQGRIAWRDTGVPNKYVVTVGDSLMYIESDLVRPSHTAYTLRIFDRKGSEIESIRDRDSVSTQQRLAEIFRLARMQALGIDEHLTELMAALDRV